MRGAKRVGAIYGYGRSGTTWLGAIVARHPDVLYRFEPFRWSRGLRAGRLTELGSDAYDADELLGPEKLYNALLPANPLFEKQPFTRKNFRYRADVGPWFRKYFYGAARKIAPLATLYKWAYTPVAPPIIVFKDVSRERVMRELLNRGHVPLVYIVRHPCGNLLSITKGQKAGLMPTERRELLDPLLKSLTPDLHEQFRNRLPGLTILEKETLLWRASVEHCCRNVMKSKHALLVFYENLCKDPVGVTQEVMDCFGLGLDDKVRHFLEGAATSSNAHVGGRVGFSRQYFSVNKNSQTVAYRWRTELTEDQKSSIMDIVGDSFVWRLGQKEAGWE